MSGICKPRLSQLETAIEKAMRNPQDLNVGEVFFDVVWHFELRAV